jgi:hypothetical protein
MTNIVRWEVGIWHRQTDMQTDRQTGLERPVLHDMIELRIAILLSATMNSVAGRGNQLAIYDVGFLLFGTARTDQGPPLGGPNLV